MRSFVVVLLVVAIAAWAVPAHAATAVLVPAGTRVLLKFVTPVNSATITEGTVIKFEVAADVLVGRSSVFRPGAAAQGTVTDVSGPGIFGENAVVHIGYIQATAVDGRPVRLSPLDVTPNSIRVIKDVGAAGASSVAGAILLGPIGLAAGALVRGGQVSVPAGAVGTVAIEHSVTVTVP